MNEILVVGIISAIALTVFVYGAYALGKCFGQQEQQLKEVKREQQRYRDEVNEKQHKMEKDWQENWEAIEAEVAASENVTHVTKVVPDAPVPTPPTEIKRRPIRIQNK